MDVCGIYLLGKCYISIFFIKNVVEVILHKIKLTMYTYCSRVEE